MNHEDTAPLLFDGMLLLADPSLKESFFYKSVILIYQHHPDKGAKGFVLTRPKHIDHDKSDSKNYKIPKKENNNKIKKINNINIFMGGPVHPNELVFCHLKWNSKINKIKFQTHISKEHADKLMKENKDVRAFFGYSEWTPYQLETEIKNGSWIICNPQKKILETNNFESYWENILKHMGAWYELISKTPKKPFLN